LKSQRLIEAFKKTSHNFRQALYLLLGFKMDSLADSNFRLTSMYAENDDDNLMFKVCSFYWLNSKNFLKIKFALDPQ